MIASEVPGGKWVIMSPNVNYLRMPVLDSVPVDVFHNDHSHFGQFDPTRWAFALSLVQTGRSSAGLHGSLSQQVWW